MKQIIYLVIFVILLYTTANANSPIYKYEVLSRTGLPIADLGDVVDLGRGPSINDSGKVAFIARDQPDYHGRILLKNQDTGNIDINEPIFNIQYVADDLQVNNNDQIAWRFTNYNDTYSEVIRSGISGGVVIATGEYGSTFDYILQWPTINNNGRVLVGVDIGSITTLCTGTDGVGPDNISSDPLTGFPDLFPMISDDNKTIVRWGGDATSSLVCYTNEQLNNRSIIAHASEYTEIGQKPGISDDGRVLVYAANHSTIGKYIFSKALFSPNALPAPVVKLSAEDSLDFRVAVNRRFSDSEEKYTVIYGANDPKSGAFGLYAHYIDVQDPANINYEREPELLAQIGGTIGNFIITIQDISIYDPINNNEQVTFWIQTDLGTQAIIRATGDTRDTDGDGLYDTWETEGIDIGYDEIIELDLPAMGADPLHKDLFVEIELMDNVLFKETSIQMVRDAFAYAPILNPDGTYGINLHWDADTEAAGQLPPFQESIDDDLSSDFRSIKEAYWGTKSERDDLANSTNYREARRMAIRYCLYANKFDNPKLGGRGELGGNDFAIPASLLNERATAISFMHELGHNLGLDEGGGDNILFKPNYISVMNYGFEAFTRNGAKLDLDYSREEMEPLNESDLSELDGIVSSVTPDVVTCYAIQYPNNKKAIKKVLLNTKPHDWNDNNNKTDEGVVIDLNWMGPKIKETPGQTLSGHNDWANLTLRISSIGPNASGVISNLEPEPMTSDMTEWILAASADINCDGRVDFEDFSILAGQWNQSPSVPLADIAPFGGDNMVNILDIIVLAEHWLEGAL